MITISESNRFYIQEEGAAEEPAIRVGSTLDFFRGGIGSKYRPDVLDDGNMKHENIESIKSFLDMSLAEGMTEESWGPSKLLRHQPV